MEKFLFPFSEKFADHNLVTRFYSNSRKSHHYTANPLIVVKYP